MQKNIWSRNIDWVKSGSTSPFFYVKQNRFETYDDKKIISVGDIYFRLNKYLTGVTFTYINSLNNIYKKDLLTGDGYSLVNMYNEYDIIDKTMKNIISVDIAADTNIDLNLQWFNINGAKVIPGHLVLLLNQNSEFENDIYLVDNQYFLNNAGYLSTREKSEKFSCSVKLGKNADKQYFLVNNGFVFPTSFEPKYFIEGKSYILKNLINYNLYNTSTGSTSKIIFTDLDVARKQLEENDIFYDEFYALNSGVTISVLSASTPANYVTLSYHHNPDYIIRSGITNEFTGSTSNIVNTYSGFTISGETGTSIPYPATFNCVVGDYIDLIIYSGVSVYSGISHLEISTFIKNIKNNYILLEELIPNYILNDLINCNFLVKNKNVAINWVDALNKLSDSTPYSDFYSVFTEQGLTTPVIEITLSPKQSVYDKYFDYDALKFKFKDTNDLRYFYTQNQYINYNLYNRLSQISTGFTSGFTIFNTFLLSGTSLKSYLYTDDGRIKIDTTIKATDFFKPYTYIYSSASGQTTQKTLVYSVTEHEIIIERPKNWAQYPTQSQLPQLISIQNIDGLKNISDMLYEVYMNQEYDWYIQKSDNERKYISKSYADLLISNNFFRRNVTGIIYENENNEFVLNLYDIETDPNLFFSTIEVIFIGSDRKSRLPISLKLIN